MRIYYGVSTGDTGDYSDGITTLDDEPVYNIWYIENNQIVYVN